MRCPTGSVFGQPIPGIVKIVGDLFFQGVHGAEFDLLTQSLTKHNVDLTTVECASKVKQVHFQRRLLAINRWPQADIGDAIVGQTVIKRRADDVNALQGRHALKQNIGCWRPDFAPELTSVDYSTGDPVSMAQKRFRFGQSVQGQSIANPGTAHPLPVDGHRAGILYREALALTGFPQQHEITSAVTAESKIIAHHQVAYAKSIDQNGVNKFPTC